VQNICKNRLIATVGVTGELNRNLWAGGGKPAMCIIHHLSFAVEEMECPLTHLKKFMIYWK